MKQESRTNINRVKKDISSPDSFTPPEELKRQLITTMHCIYDEEDSEAVERAYKVAYKAHEKQKRKSGEPYIIHPICVAIILAELELDKETIMAGLLHDVVEDTETTHEDIVRDFGEEVAQLVDGVTKLGQLSYSKDKIEVQAENLRKMFLAMAKDIRVILIKLADRLHNMRTMQFMRPEKQKEKSRETMDIYAPIAHRLGISKIKVELDDLALRYLKPDVYEDLERSLDSAKEEREAFIQEIVDEVKGHIDHAGIKAEIDGRVKHMFSIYKKMVNQHKTIDQIYDLFAVRIKVDTVKDCYAALGIIHEMYKPIPGRFKDYIAMPKPNMYQSLHTTLIGPEGHPFEIQIRTFEMHRVAEYGIAAHWKYKDGVPAELNDDTELNNWLSTIKEILDDPQPDAMDFLDTVKLNLFASEIFVFTPKGEIKTMPAGCTALDFAFQIHTFLGSHCIGAKVNHKRVPLSHKLQSGDQVEILSSKSQHVQASWINFVSTAKAKGKILAILRRDNRELQKKGEQILDDWLRKNELEMTTPVLTKLCDFHEFKKTDDLFLAIGKRTVLLGEKDLEELREKKPENNGGWRRYVPFLSRNERREDKKTEYFTVGEGFNKKKPVYVNEENISKFVFPACCHAIPGDDILGYIDNKNRIEIHRRDCTVASKLKATYGKRILDAKWDMHKVMFFDATIEIHGIDRKRMLHDVSEVISDKLDVNIHKVTIESNEGIFEGQIEIRVHDRSEVKVIMDELKKIDDIKEVLQIL